MTGLAALLGTRDGDDLLPDPSWVNSWGTAFGGWAVAALLDRWCTDLPADRALGSAHLAFGRPAALAPLAVATRITQDGRTVTRLDGEVAQGGAPCVQGFAVATRAAGPSTDEGGLDPSIPAAHELPAPPDDGRTADVIRHHFELRVVGRPPTGEAVVRQWVRLRHLEPGADGRHPLAVLGLLADLASVGVFRTAARELGGTPVVKSLDLGLHLAGPAPGRWTLMTLATPPIRDGVAVAQATLHDEAGRHLASAAQQVLVS